MSRGIIGNAFRLWAECRAEFEQYRLDAYDKAAEATRGRLLNRRGMEAGIDSLSLFMGNRARAYAYASEELVEWWATHQRPVYAEFEAIWMQTWEAERFGG